MPEQSGWKVRKESLFLWWRQSSATVPFPLPPPGPCWRAQSPSFTSRIKRLILRLGLLNMRQTGETWGFFLSDISKIQNWSEQMLKEKKRLEERRPKNRLNKDYLFQFSILYLSKTKKKKKSTSDQLRHRVSIKLPDNTFISVKDVQVSTGGTIQLYSEVNSSLSSHI